MIPRSLLCLTISTIFTATAFSARALDPIEGIWQWPDDGAVMKIEALSETAFSIVLLDSPDLTIKPGTEIGRAVATPRKGSYDAAINTREALRPGAKLKSEQCVISVTDHGSLVFKPYRAGLRVNLLRLFPYFHRVRPYYEDSRPDDIDGPRRIYPDGRRQYLPCYEIVRCPAHHHMRGIGIGPQRAVDPPKACAEGLG